MLLASPMREYLVFIVFLKRWDGAHAFSPVIGIRNRGGQVESLRRALIWVWEVSGGKSWAALSRTALGERSAFDLIGRTNKIECVANDHSSTYSIRLL